MRTERPTTISREGWWYLLLLAVVFAWAMLREANLLLLVAGLMCGPVACSWWLLRTVFRGVGVRRTLPRAAYAGQAVAVEVELRTGRKRRGTWALVVTERVRRDDARRGPAQRAAVLFSYVPAGATCRRAYRGRFAERGRYRFGPLEVSTRFPFGLLRRRMTVDRRHALTVYPRLGRLTSAWNARHRDAPHGRRGGGRPGRAPGEFCGVREWRPGDSIRRVHWRSTARHGEVVVCQFDQRRSRDLVVLVDLWQPGRPGPEDLEEVERAVSFAATVVADVCRRGGGHLTLGITGAAPDVTAGPPSALLLERALERLAVAEASEEDRLPALCAAALARVRPGAELVLVSPRRRDPGDTFASAAPGADGTPVLAPGAVCTLCVADPAFGQYFTLEPRGKKDEG
jgi:uncharacterized protein (DUF58 family)